MLTQIINSRTGLVTFCLVMGGCTVSTGVVFDQSKANHSDAEFVSVKDGSFLDHYRMRQREPSPPDPDEVASIVGSADLGLIRSLAEQARVTWIGHASALVQYQDISFLTDPHLTSYPFAWEFMVEPRYTEPALSFE